MNILYITMCAGAIAGLTLAGCDSSESSANSGAKPQNEATASDVVREASEAAQTAGDFAQATIEKYIDTAREGLSSVDTSIKTFSQRVENMSGEAKITAQQALEKLREQRDTYVSELDEASANSAKAWSDVMGGLDRAWADLESATKLAADQFGSQP
jgi:hypothetical protein